MSDTSTPTVSKYKTEEYLELCKKLQEQINRIKENRSHWRCIGWSYEARKLHIALSLYRGTPINDIEDVCKTRRVLNSNDVKGYLYPLWEGQYGEGVQAPEKDKIFAEIDRHCAMIWSRPDYIVGHLYV